MDIEQQQQTTSSSNEKKFIICNPDEAGFTIWARHIQKKIIDTELSRIGSTRLYIGSLACAMDENLLRDNGITHVLTVGKGLVSDDAEDGFTIPSQFKVHRAVLHLSDNAQERLVDDALVAALKFIDEGLTWNNHTGGVLVHCEKGLSRSPSVVCAYLMTRQKLSMEEVFDMIRTSRPQIRPNINFALQLRGLEANQLSEQISQLAISQSHSSNSVAV